ncbi:hypothetical protein PFISCL1PPCAC_12518, partial [Pristionchus fissidentatus]
SYQSESLLSHSNYLFAHFCSFFCYLQASMACVAPAEDHTYFAKKEHLFPCLEEDTGIPTEQFLSACQGLADFVGFMGAAFSPVKSDIAGNVTKVRTRWLKDPIGQDTLQKLIDSDLKENGGKLGIATEGLLWLKRGLEFMLLMLINMVRDFRTDKAKTESLVSVINAAYEGSLKRHHNFISKQVFKVVIHAAPYRKTILKAVAEGREGMDEICIGHIEEHLDNFKVNVKTLVDYYVAKGLDTPFPEKQ